MKEDGHSADFRVPVESLRRGLSILELISFSSSGSGLSLREISQRMGLRRSTAHNLLKTLCLCGYAENCGSGVYRGGWKLRQFTRSPSLFHFRGAFFRSVLGDLAFRSGEALVFATLLNGRRQVVARARGGQEIQVDLLQLESENLSIWRTVTGKILASFCSAPELSLICQHYGLPDSHSWPGIHDLEALHSALGAIRRRGEISNFASPVCSAAVPVFTAHRQLLGALGIHFPQYRHRPDDDPALFSLLRQGAAELSAALEAANEPEEIAAAQLSPEEQSILET